MGNDNLNNNNNNTEDFGEFEDISSGNRLPFDDDDVNLYTGEAQQEGVSLNSFLEDEEGKGGKSGAKKEKKKKENIINEDESKAVRIFKRIARVCLVTLLIGVITLGIIIGTGLTALSVLEGQGAFDLEEVDLNEALDFTTTIYAKNEDGEYEEYQRLHGKYNRIWVSIEDIPDMLENSFIAIEDKRFRTHAGVDWKRTASAFINSFINVYGGRQGGSTITQQLVKNITEDNDISAMRKVREIMRARYLEENYSKDSILEWYLNTIPMGNGLYGVESAANYYFGKTVSELTIHECASLASITNIPESYRPDLKENEENHLSRRNLILNEMYTQKYITKEEYEKAKEAKLKVTADEGALIPEETVNSYFVDAIIEDVIDMLVEEKGYDVDVAEREVYSGGYKIYATIDLDIQKTLDKVYKDESYFDSPTTQTEVEDPETGEKKMATVTPNSSMTIMDYEGHVVGIVGGKGVKEKNRSLNRATQSPRQIGSTMKPIGVYALALEYNEITYSSLVNDRKMKWGNPTVEGGTWPSNYPGEPYEGKVTVEKALYRSKNCPPVYILRELIGNGSDDYSIENNGLDISYDFLTKKLGFKHLNVSGDRNFSSLCLGGCAYGATTKELAAAYAVFGNQGNYYKPTTYTVIYDQFGNVVDDTTKDKPIAAISEDTATVMNRLLRQVVEHSNGTGTAAAIDGFDVFAKTGTTSDYHDLLFAGGTPHYVAACWFGYDENLSMNNSNGREALYIWHDVMEEIHKDLPEKEFEYSDLAEKMKFCQSSGLIASSRCKSTGTGWYRADNIPETCTECKKVKKKNKDKDKDKDKEEDKDKDKENDKDKDSSKQEDTSSKKTESKKPSSSSSGAASSSPSSTSSQSTSTEAVTSKPVESEATVSSEATSTLVESQTQSSSSGTTE